jgi:hypothetical protein
VTIGTVIGKPVSLALDLSILSERVINSLYRINNLTSEDRIVFKKAADFFEYVQRGENAVNRLELSVTKSGRDIESFGLAANAYTYKISGRRHHTKEQPSRIKETTNRLLNTAKKLSEGEVLPAGKDIEELRDFFQSAKAITKSLTAGEIDRVKIG